MREGSVFEVHYRTIINDVPQEPQKVHVAAVTEDEARLAVEASTPDVTVEFLAVHKQYGVLISDGDEPVIEDRDSAPKPPSDSTIPDRLLSGDVPLADGSTKYAGELKAGDTLVDGFVVVSISGPDDQGNFTVKVSIPTPSPNSELTA